MRRLAVVLLALSLVLPAQAQSVQPLTASKPAVKKPPKAVAASRPAAPAAGGPCLCVISRIGDRFGVKNIGLALFGIDYKTIPVDNWGLDDLVVERVRAAVGPGQVVRRIATAIDVLRSDTSGKFGPFMTLNEKAAAIMRWAAAQKECERYVVVTRTFGAFGGQPIHGVGIVSSGRPIVSHIALHAMIRIELHDGRTLEVIRSAVGSIGGGQNFLTRGPPIRQLDDSWWPETPEAANTPAMRKATRDLLAEVLDKSLPELLAPVATAGSPPSAPADPTAHECDGPAQAQAGPSGCGSP
jgi:hypothetical protein